MFLALAAFAASASAMALAEGGKAARNESTAGASSTMDIYLPIAELSMNLFFLVGMGAAVGFLSGLFGVGGGFLLTPLLIFIGGPKVICG